MAVASLPLLLWAADSDAASAPRPEPGCTIVGTAGDDVLAGTAGTDVLCGRGGDDSIYGHGGGDALVGGPGRDALFGGAGDDLLVGEHGHDILRGGNGHDVVRKQPLRNDRDYQVDVEASYNVPYGTRITWKILNGVCTKREFESSFVYDQSVRELITPFYTVIGGGLTSECGYLRSYVRYNVRFETPDDVKTDINVNVKQSALPNIYVRSFEVECEQQKIRCEGTVDSRLAEYGGVPTPTVTFGPLPPKPDPEPTVPPTLSCKDSITVKAKVQLKDIPICTSTGKPLPALTLNGVVPPSIGIARSGPAGASVVLNGSFPEAKKYALIVRGRVPSPPWEEEEIVLVTAEP